MGLWAEAAFVVSRQDIQLTILSAYRFGCMNNGFSKLATKADIYLCLD